MINVESVTVGSDIELPLFLLDGTAFPVTGLVKGSKAEPRPITKLGQGFAVQEDNVMLEFNIPPAKTAKAFESNVWKMLNHLPKELPPTVIWDIQAAVEYKPIFLEHPSAQVFGCDPDYNVYTREENPRPHCDNPALRTAAAHLHVGWDGPTNDDRMNLIRWLDVTVGLAFARRESLERRKLYGKAGAFRPKKYGVEYRTPGNFWVREYSSHVFKCIQQAIERVNAGTKLEKEEEDGVIDAINTCKLNPVASKVANKYGIYLL